MQAVSCRYGFGTKSVRDFDSTIALLEALLSARDFKILSRIDVGASLRPLDADFRRYQTFAACKLEHAKMAFDADINIGLLLPCNIVVYENDDGEVTVLAKDPARLMDLVDHPLAIVAAIELKEELETIVAGC